MLSMESRVEIEVLYRQGKGIREIARMPGLARNTVRDVLRGQSDGHWHLRNGWPAAAGWSDSLRH
jgi:transposase